MGIELSKAALDVGIVTTNFEAMMAFYVDALGFTPTEANSYPGAGTVQRLDLGQSILRLLAVETVPPNTSPDGLRDSTGIRYLTINVVDINEAYAACVGAGVQVVGPPSELRPGVLSVRAQDPDGNWIEFLQGA
jgi:catechol 2,3-dioxygenase-like lactoylglutathione lyase family enzyme